MGNEARTHFDGFGRLGVIWGWDETMRWWVTRGAVIPRRGIADAPVVVTSTCPEQEPQHKHGRTFGPNL